MNVRDRKRMEALERRRAFLESRIANYRADGNPSHDKSELGALTWAIRIVKRCESEGILEEMSQ